MIRLLVVMFIASLGAISHAQSSVISYSTLQQLIVPMPEASAGVKGSFLQSKFLSALDTHLISSGKFEYVAIDKLHWDTLKPIVSRLIITPSTLVAEQDGEEISRLDGQSNPQVAVFSGILFSVMSAQWSGLARHFDLQGKITGTQWDVILTPKDPVVGRAIKQVDLSGDSQLRQIRVIEANGDYTYIQLKHLKRP